MWYKREVWLYISHNGLTVWLNALVWLSCTCNRVIDDVKRIDARNRVLSLPWQLPQRSTDSMQLSRSFQYCLIVISSLLQQLQRHTASNAFLGHRCLHCRSRRRRRCLLDLPPLFLPPYTQALSISRHSSYTDSISFSIHHRAVWLTLIRNPDSCLSHTDRSTDRPLSSRRRRRPWLLYISRPFPPHKVPPSQRSSSVSFSHYLYHILRSPLSAHQ